MLHYFSPAILLSPWLTGNYTTTQSFSMIIALVNPNCSTSCFTFLSHFAAQLQLIPWPRQKCICPVHTGPLGGGAGHWPGVGATRPQRHSACQYRRHHPVRSLLHQRIQLGGNPGTGLRRHSPGRSAFHLFTPDAF